MRDDTNELIIIGGGPAAYTAALYAARANLRPLVFEGIARGGQLMITSEVDNYPGFPAGILGPELMDAFRAQAERFGARLVTDDVTAVAFSSDPSADPHQVSVDDDTYHARSVIVATGANARQLGLASERGLQGRGVSYCAVCDGAFFRDQSLIVVGGGDSAMEEATFLARFARDITIVHRRHVLRASQIMQERARGNAKITFRLGYVVEEVLGDERVTGATLRDVATGETQELTTDGVFVAIGHDPNTALFRGQLAMDEAGYLTQKPGSTATDVAGVFAAGDVVDHVYRQAVTAAGSGCEAALDAERWLVAREATPAALPA
jgi:thioredoxin reductase (NADPH)